VCDLPCGKLLFDFGRSPITLLFRKPQVELDQVHIRLRCRLSTDRAAGNQQAEDQNPLEKFYANTL
jgi:hypothetical protein